MKHSYELVLVHAKDDELVVYKDEVKSQTSRKKLRQHLQKRSAGLIGKALEHAPTGTLPTPTALLESIDPESKHLDNAYMVSLLSANTEFFNRLTITHAPPETDYELDARFLDEDFALKIAPCHLKHLDHPEVICGQLWHKKDKHKQTLAYLRQSYEAEKQQGHPIAGLRIPYASTDVALGLHILELSYDVVHFLHELSCFGQLCSPGDTVCKFPCAGVHRTVFHLKPFDDAHYKDKCYVLPCTRDAIFPLDESLACSLLAGLETGFRKYRHLFSQEPGETNAPLRLLPFLRPTNEHAPQPTEEDHLLSQMGGIPLCGAYRLGQVLAILDTFSTPMPVEKKFLVSSIRRLGPNASLSDAIKETDKLEKQTETIRNLNAQISVLETAKQTAETLAANASASRAATPAPLRELTPFHVARAIWDENFQLKQGLECELQTTPIESAQYNIVVKAIAQCGERNVTAFTEKEHKAWARNLPNTHPGLSHLASIAHVANKLYPDRQTLIIEHDEELKAARFFRCGKDTPDDPLLTPIATNEVISMKKRPRDGNARYPVVVLYKEQSKKLVTMIDKQSA